MTAAAATAVARAVARRLPNGGLTRSRPRPITSRGVSLRAVPAVTAASTRARPAVKRYQCRSSTTGPTTFGEVRVRLNVLISAGSGGRTHILVSSLYSTSCRWSSVQT